MAKIIILFSLVLVARLLLFVNLGGEFEYQKGLEKDIPIVSPIKERITENTQKVLPPDASALLLGIVFGDKGNFDEEYFEAIRTTGVLHVIAASGMNVSMVAGVIFASLAYFMSRRKALIFSTLTIVIYAAFAEFEESIVRASIMAIFAYGAALFGRQNTSLAALLFAAFLMIMVTPEILVSVGFQLSFAATAGIILFDPVFRKLGNNIFLEDIRTTTSAQIATVPILLFYFGTFSPVSFLTNLLILWTIPPLMVLGGVGSLISLVVQPLSVPIFWLAFPLLEYFKIVVLNLNYYSFSIDVKNLPILMILGYYTLILASILALWKHLKIRL